MSHFLLTEGVDRNMQLMKKYENLILIVSYFLYLLQCYA